MRLIADPSKRSFTSQSSMVCSSASAPQSKGGGRSSEVASRDASRGRPRSLSSRATAAKLSVVGYRRDLMATSSDGSAYMSPMAALIQSLEDFGPEGTSWNAARLWPSVMKYG